MVNDLCGNPKAVFKGIYTVDDPDNVVKVYSLFSGLGLPSERIDELKKETLELQAKVKNNNDQRNLTLQLDSGKNEVISAAQKVKDKIAEKSSALIRAVLRVHDQKLAPWPDHSLLAPSSHRFAHRHTSPHSIKD